MHVLGHSFSQKRKSTKRPRDLHIRKVSFCGSSHSGCSLSSSDSTASACTVIIPPQYADHAPPRLHERAFKDKSPSRPRSESVSYFDDSDSVVMEDDEDDYYSGDEDDENLPHFIMAMPPGAACEEENVHEKHESSDYFAFQLATRPPMPRSRWSESTIQSVQSIDAIPTPGSTISTAVTETGEDICPPVRVEMPPNFSRRALSTPTATVSAPTNGRRPPMRTMDSVDEFVKRGGWKRRGIIFQQEEINEADLSR